eukprot:564693_1
MAFSIPNTKLQHLQKTLLVGVFCVVMGFVYFYVFFIASIFEPTSSNIFPTKNKSSSNIHGFELDKIANQTSPTLSTDDATHGRLESLNVPEIPSLVLLGPPKSGSRTFINWFSKYDNVLAFGRERAFWCGGNRLRCNPKQNETEWMRYLDEFESNSNTLARLVEVIQSDKSNSRCTVERNQYLWKSQEFNMTHKKCIHSLNQSTCYLVEKGPGQSRVPWVPILFANLMPRTKTFIIVRNPVYHVVSCAIAFGFATKGSDQREIKHGIVDAIRSHEGFNVLTNVCKEINHKWNSYGDAMHRFVQLKTDYKRFIVTYLWRKFVDPMDIQSRGLREDLFMWAPFTFPVFLISLFSHDEVLNNTVWYDWTPIQSYRVVQFEWLYADIPNAMKTIKCWVMELNTIECDTHLPDAQNRDIFESESIERHNHIENATVWQQPYAWYEDNIRQLFNPCYDTMQHILLHDRPHLLLGEWKSWNYSYTF